MTENSNIPKREAKEAKGLTKFLYKAMDWCGLTSGIGLIAWGGWWFIWSLGNYIFISPQSAMQQIVSENYFNQVQLSAILVALGVLIMEIKNLGRND